MEAKIRFTRCLTRLEIEAFLADVQDMEGNRMVEIPLIGKGCWIGIVHPHAESFSNHPGFPDNDGLGASALPVKTWL